MKAAAVLYVKNLARMQSFYQACFNLNPADRTDDYCVLESEWLTLSLVVVPERVAALMDVTVPPIRRERVPIKLAFEVVSIGALRPLIAELGGGVDPPTSEWEFRGSRHCDGVDSEGNVIQLLEAITP